MRVHDIKPFLLQERPQSKHRSDVQGVSEGKFDFRVHRAASPAGDDDIVAALPQS